MRLFTLVLFLGGEVLTLAAHAIRGGRAWRTARCSLVYAGVAMRSAQMLACSVGFLPHMLRVRGGGGSCRTGGKAAGGGLHL